MKAYMNPYLAGVGIGVVLLATFVLTHHGLGASGAAVSLVTAGAQVVAPAHVSGNPFLSAYAASTPGATLDTWLVWELLGVTLGGGISAWLAGRMRGTIERGPRIGVTGRLGAAFGGGILMGFATRLARGCTSGQALTGGALLNAGSWAFMVALFAGAYLTARIVRRQWT